MKPNKKNIRLWVKALRSGKYKQGRFRLRTGKGKDAVYCCLGVVCVISRTKYDGLAGSLPPKAQKWLGLSRNPALARVSGKEITAIDANDTLFWNFNHIADALEKRYLK